MIIFVGCKDDSWNDPYPNEMANANTYYSAFAERPKHLDPARSYSSGEWTFISNIYEPPLQYHYLKRPYTLVPLSANSLPKVTYIDDNGNIIDPNGGKVVSYSIYEINIKSGILYQPHPAFAKLNDGEYAYHKLSEEVINGYNNLDNFKQVGTRELVADDYVHQMKRLADPKLNSPIFGFMSTYIKGLKELREDLVKANEKLKPGQKIDLRKFKIEGVELKDKYTYTIKVKGQYPQLVYWLAMPFFAPMPWEADLFYAQKGMKEHNITLDWYPVGTGPYMLQENNPERRMVMVKNPNFHGEKYPSIGEKGDLEKGLLADAGKSLPFIDKIVFSLEKEDIPYWNKFLQGYYDTSGISSDQFESAIDTSPAGGLDLTNKLKEQGIYLEVTTAPSTMYWAFNMLDEVVGGYEESEKKLRNAISIALDVEEFIQIFANGRGIVAHHPIPPGILGHSLGANPKVYENGAQPIRKSLKYAKQLLEEAGYPNGRDKKTGESLTIYFEAISSGDPNEKAIYAWLRKQLSKLGVELVVRATDYNRFREKMHSGLGQLFFWGWNADYPDPENFLFMFYGPNSKVKSGGENAANYQNTEFDKLFEIFQLELNSATRLNLIKKMIAILQEDAPWIWGYHPQSFSLYHTWDYITKPNSMARNTLKYVKIDSDLRSTKRDLWNKPLIWPLGIMIFCILMVICPAFISFYYRSRSKVKRV